MARLAPLAVGVLAGGLAAGCDHGGAHLGARQQLVGGANSGELSAVVSPPGERCQNGTLSVHEWKQSYVGNLDDFGEADGFTQLARDFDLERTDAATFTTAGPGGPVEVRESFRHFGDPEVVRLPDGRLLFTRLHWRGWSFQRRTDPANADTVFDSWAEYEAIQALAAGSGPDADLAKWKLEHRLRSEQIFLVSEDCGRTWEYHSFIDAQTADGGFCSEPRRGAEVALTGGGTDNKYWPGGFDRPELYVDPWSGVVWFTANCKAGKDEQTIQERIFRLQPGSTEWQALPTVFSRDGTTGSPGKVPLVMTTTKNGALWIFTGARIEKGGVDRHPFVYRSIDQGESFAIIDLADPFVDQATHQPLATPVPALAAPLCATADRELPLAGGRALLSHDWSIARAGSNGVRIAYLASDVDGASGPTSIQTYYVFHKGDENDTASLTAVRGSRFTASAGTAWAINPTFIEYDETVFEETAGKPVALLYWLESDPANDSLRVRARYSPEPLVYDGPLELDDWPAAPQGHPGDFMNGGSYCGPGAGGTRIHFLPVWASWRPDEAYTITVADIDVDRPCQPAAAATKP